MKKICAWEVQGDGSRRRCCVGACRRTAEVLRRCVQADDSRRGGKGGRGSGWLLAPLPSANQLPVAKFVSNGFLINQLGQVDLRLAPLDTRHPLPRPPFPPRLLPGFRHTVVCFRLVCWIDAWFDTDVWFFVAAIYRKGASFFENI